MLVDVTFNDANLVMVMNLGPFILGEIEIIVVVVKLPAISV